jgi:hypothetical protein
MIASRARKGWQGWAAQLRRLTGLLCLMLALASGGNATHAAGHGIAHAVETAIGDSSCDRCAAVRQHAIGPSCAVGQSCVMSAILAVAPSPPQPPSALAGQRDDRLRRGIDTLPRPRPPKLAAAT